MESGGDQANIGRRVREARLSVGFTEQLPFAQALGVDRQSVSNWEQGRQKVTPDRATVIEYLCNADAGYILGGEGRLHGGEPRLTPPTAGEISMLHRLTDLEREVAAMRALILALSPANSADIESAIDSARSAAATAGRAARSEESRQG